MININNIQKCFTTIKLPKGTSNICFTQKENYDSLAFPELDIQVGLRTDKNTFLLPQIYPPQDIKGFAISENPSCFSTTNQLLDISFENTNNGVLIESQTNQLPKKCITLSEQNPDKIEIVFIGSGYDNLDELSIDATSYINEIFKNVEPFKSQSDLFNFYLVPDKADCKVGSIIECDNNQLVELASQCPNDYILLLSNRNQILNAFVPVRSSAIGNIIKVNTADNPLVIAHEMGHSLANLADEYVDDSYYSLPNFHIEDRPNCSV